MHIPSFMRLALIVFKLSKDPDFQRTDRQTDRLTDGQTDRQTEGKPIVPSRVNTGRGLIMDKNITYTLYKNIKNNCSILNRVGGVIIAMPYNTMYC